jgi:hypothetical protein
MTENGKKGPIGESPIPQLRDFELPRDPDFEGRVWRSIDRRETAGHLLELCTEGQFVMLMEYAAALLGLASDPGGTRQENREE